MLTQLKSHSLTQTQLTKSDWLTTLPYGKHQHYEQELQAKVLDLVKEYWTVTGDSVYGGIPTGDNNYMHRIAKEVSALTQ